MTVERIRVPADVCSYIGEENRNPSLEVAIAGVQKDDIRLPMTEKSFDPETR